jgi:hypothetical protein
MLWAFYIIPETKPTCPGIPLDGVTTDIILKTRLRAANEWKPYKVQPHPGRK